MFRLKPASFNLAGVSTLYTLWLIPLFLSGNMSPILMLKMACIAMGFTLIGFSLPGFTRLFENCASISQTVIAFFLGGLVSTFLLFLPIAKNMQFYLVLILSAVALLSWRRNLRWIFEYSKHDFILLSACLFFLLLIIFQGDYFSIASREQRIYDSTLSDPIFFTSLVASIREGTIYSAAYELGSPINYHSLGFFFPALVGNIFELSSFQSLWGLTMPIYQLLALLLTHELVFRFWRDRISINKYGMIILSVAMPLLLVPVHPLYVLKGDPLNFIHNGIGYLIPGESCTTTFGIVLFLLCLLMFFAIDWKDNSVKPKIVFACLSALLVVGKLPVAFLFSVFVGTVVVYRTLTGRGTVRQYLPYALLYLVTASALYMLFFTNTPSGKGVVRFGYLLTYFGDLFQKTITGTFDYVLVFVLALLLFVVWMGIRLVGLFYSLKKTSTKELLVGGIVSFVAGLAVSIFIGQLFFDGSGKIVKDGSFDVLFFPRFAFYILTLVSVIGFAGLIEYQKKTIRRTVGILVSFWMMIGLTSHLATAKANIETKTSMTEKPKQWYEENYQVLKSGRLEDGLILADPWNTKSVAFASSDYGHYWTSLAVGTGLYNSTLKNAHRWAVYNRLIEHPNKEILRQLAEEGVKYIIASPKDLTRFEEMEARFPDVLEQLPGTKWVFQID